MLEDSASPRFEIGVHLPDLAIERVHARDEEAGVARGILGGALADLSSVAAHEKTNARA